MERTESVGIIGSNKGAAELVGSIFRSHGYETWTAVRRNTKRELKKRLATCRVIVFDVENEEEYKKEARKRHALIGDIKAMEPRIETICMIHESLCEGRECKMRCTKVTCKDRSLSMLRSEVERVIQRVDLKIW